MKRILAVLAVAGVLIIAGLTIAAGPAGKSSREIPDEMEAIRGHIAALEPRMANFETQVRQMLSAQDGSGKIIPRYLPELRQLPKGARPFEFNGMLFYICPLRQNTAASTPEPK